ncbi:hypothetical protein AB0N59_05950 [Microbacterium sp. NPDC089321]|uniref:hypothetical protein n=1 Tax=Microbacterium sp. NPDC089321 TaxID=3155183 RepID=UPI00344101C6
MGEMLKATGRVLWRHWPALLLWFFAGVVARYFIIQLAGFAGGYNSTLGMLILPLAVLARLISFVGMFLVVRDGLRNLQAIAPVPEDARERRTAFVGSLMASILPFYAVYAAAGNLKEDAAEYANIALAISFGNNLSAAVGGRTVTEQDVALEVSLGPWVLLIIGLAYAGRWAWKKWSDRLPRFAALVAVYLEVVWVAFAVALIGDATSAVQGWVDTRVAMVWLDGVRTWVGEQLAPLAAVWDAIGWLLGEAGGIILQPLAWLMIAGVIYGQTIVAEKLRIENRLLERAKARAERVPSAIRRRAGDLGDELTSRFRPIGRAIVLMWRAGPIMIAAYVLLYTVALALEPLGRLAIVSLIGPQELVVWGTFSTLIATAPLLIAEPARIALVSAAYDSTLKATRSARAEESEALAEEIAQDAIEQPAQPAVAEAPIPAEVTIPDDAPVLSDAGGTQPSPEGAPPLPLDQDGSISNRTNLPSMPVPPSSGSSSSPSLPKPL